MANSPAVQRRRVNNIHRPQVYVSVEFGVSWSNRHAPNNHQLTYRSKGLKERAPNFPRYVPPPTTNYLAAPQHHQHHQHRNPDTSSRQREHRQQRPQPRQAVATIDEGDEVRRSSRDSRSSYERGRSAPPAINSSPWDISTLEGSAMPSSSWQPAAVAAAQRSPLPPPMVWKELPELPSRYRLGEDGMPWSSWSWPMGYDPDVDPDDARLSRMILEEEAEDVLPDESKGDEVSFNHGSPTYHSLSVEMPRYREEAPAPKHELGALSAAMATVDNGFENQWWNQGQRQTMNLSRPAATPAAAVSTPSPIATRIHHQPSVSAPSVGWAVADGRRETGISSPASTRVVSPMMPSDYGFYARDPPPSYQPLTRSISTRSAELFFAGDRYA